MCFVYLLRSLSSTTQKYIGLANDPDRRLLQHNRGENRSTARYRPWEIVVVIRFKNSERAAAFEQYLKSGSGWSFANRHLW